jgi:thiamine-monophosphate kinase
MSRESAFIARLAAIARDPAARGLADDCAVLPMGTRDLVLTHDMLVEGIHYLPDDPPEDIAWKLVAVNLSDLAAKGARPIGVLLGYPLGPDAKWDAAFVRGLEAVLEAYATPLLGGDTVRSTGARTLGLTAIGEVAPGGAPARSGAKAGDGLWVTGTVGGAGLGLAVALGTRPFDAGLLALYRRPEARLTAGAALAPRVDAMADVSDGLLIDAERIARASGLAVTIELDTVPFHPAVTGRLAAATAGDDYELLFAAPAGFVCPEDVTASRIGTFTAGSGLKLTEGGEPIPLPATLGYEH